ncbi:MAG: phosphoglucosamine mutase [Candidatus Kapabacteria bacterium]|nr:phosphoglucosamine mutase [Candidatus Kapabacteria bacterium]
MAFIRSISGLRATIGNDLTPFVIAKYVSALSQYAPEGDIVIGNDGRPSGKWIEMIAAGTLASLGRTVIITGVVPTPTVQLLVEQSGAAAGIAITASHNPDQWNGLKFINSDGVFFDIHENQKFWELVDAIDEEKLSTSTSGCILYDLTSLSDHVEFVLKLSIINQVDFVNKLKNRNFKAVVDAVNCSGSTVVPKLLDILGADCIELYCDESGIFPHTPEPLPENLGVLAETVKIHNADIGIAVDPDSDRLVIVDEHGNHIGEEFTLALAVQSALHFNSINNTDPKPKVVTNLSSSSLVDFIAAKYGATVYRSAVGEINVVKKMKETGALIGGEGSGGVILPACHYGRDSLVGIALIIALIADTNKSVSELIAEYPVFKILKSKQEFKGDLQHYFNKLSKAFPDAEINTDDGIRIDTQRGWVQVRASNTEPIIRIISESTDGDYASRLIKLAQELI